MTMTLTPATQTPVETAQDLLQSLRAARHEAEKSKDQTFEISPDSITQIIETIEALLAPPQPAREPWPTLSEAQLLKYTETRDGRLDGTLAQALLDTRKFYRTVHQPVTNARTTAVDVARNLREVAAILGMKDDGPKRDRADILRDVMTASAHELVEHAEALEAMDETSVHNDASRYRALRTLISNAVSGGVEVETDDGPGPSGVEVNDARLVYEEPTVGEEVRLYWYPNTPVGYNQIKAATLDEALDEYREYLSKSPGLLNR